MRTGRSLPFFQLAAVAGLAALVAGAVSASSLGTVVTVTAGTPSEFSFKISRTSVPWQAVAPGNTVTFKVTNRGTVSHQFKVCSASTTRAAANGCAGTATKPLAPGASATLVVRFAKQGQYGYLSPVAGQAARGMKGLLKVGTTVAKPATTTTTKTTTPPASSSTPSTSASPAPATPGASAPSVPLTGAAAAGAVVFQTVCVACHTVIERRTTGVPSDINLTHGGGPFPSALTPTQIADLRAYLTGS